MKDVMAFREQDATDQVTGMVPPNTMTCIGWITHLLRFLWRCNSFRLTEQDPLVDIKFV